MSESIDVTPPSSSAAFDYLYEFSETRKVLEEFFRCPTVPGQTQLNSNDEIVNFQVRAILYQYLYIGLFKTNL